MDINMEFRARTHHQPKQPFMRKLISRLAVLLVLSIPGFGQSSSIKGIVNDTSEHTGLVNATVSILRRSDSVLIAFARSQQKGEFNLNKLKGGKYLVMVTYPKFADYIDWVELT